jgi:hypothetical protein
MLTLISLILFVSRLLMVVELKYGRTWRNQRAEKMAIKEKKIADKKEAKLQAQNAIDQEKQQADTPSPVSTPPLAS